MPAKAMDVYQGNDWLTYRWSVAQAFDTLDRIYDLCRHVPTITSRLPQAPGSGLPRYEIAEQEIVDMFGCIAELCDDLSGELDAVQADLFSYSQPMTVQRWMGFEMHLHLRQMRQIAWSEHAAEEPSNIALDTLVALNARIRDLLKQIDQ
jgi:hypothetical protein